jgi:predicted nucleic acid-binding protein
MSQSCLIGTNILLRFFTGDPPTLANRARAIIAEADGGRLQLEIPALIVAETLYTLESFYEMPKVEVCEKLIAFLRSRGISPHQPEIILDALERYRALPVHFADAYLAATAAANQQPVYSFDKDFARFKDVNWKQ